MTSPQTLVPEIRFEGFSSAWGQRKAKELCSITTGKSNTQDQVDDGKYPFFIRSEIPVRSNRYLYDEEAVITIGDGNIGKVFHYVNGKFDLHQRCYKMADFKDIVAKYFYYFFSSHFYDRAMKMTAKATVDSVRLEMISDMEILFPKSSDEQRLIAECLTALDNLITLHQRRYDQLKNVKKSMLEKMFPRNGANVPEIRFAGFTNAWEQRKLADVLSSYTDPVEIPHTGYERLGIRSHAKGTFHSYVPAGHELQTAQMHKVAADKFIVNITFGWEHAVAVTDENDAGKLVSHRFPQFSLSEELDPKFLKFIILDENFRHHLWLASPGGAGRNRVLNLTEMLQYEIYIPSVSEQRQIADVLIRLDNLITLHQCKCDKLKEIKNSLLQKMFV